MSEYQAPPPPSEPPAPRPIPWEDPAVPAWTGFWETAKRFVVRPQDTFAHVPVNADFMRPLLYAVILGWLGAWGSYLWNAVFGDMTNALLSGGAEMDPEAMQQMALQGTIGIMITIFSPVLTIVFTFLAAAVSHLFLMVFGGNNAGYWATFRTWCYAGGTASLAGLVPVCGGMAGFVWQIVLLILGLMALHRTSGGKATMAVLAPMVLFCICMVGAFALFGAAMMSAMGEM